MPARVLLSGVPKNLRQAKLMNMLCDILRVQTTDFTAQVPPFYGPVKDVLLTFQYMSDARSAQENLDNYVFTYNRENYVFNATIVKEFQRNSGKDRNKRGRKPYQSPSSHYSREDTREQYGGGPSRNRSRSPLYSSEASRLDMQIEILKKQRMILEEERKLLEEQQKLDSIKMGSFKNERHSKRSFNEDYELNVEEKTKDVPINLLQKKFEPKILSYYKASGVILSKMYALIEKYSTKENRKLLISLIRPALKERFAAALENQPFYQTHKVIQIYRTVHPVDGDEDFVKEIAKSMNVNESSDNTQADEGNDGNGTEPLPVKISGKKMKLLYHQTIGILINKLNIHMDKHCPPEKRAKLVTLIRVELRKRLDAIAEGNDIHQSARMLKFYRAAHPATEDEELVVSVLKTIDQDSGDGANKDKTSSTEDAKSKATCEEEKENAGDNDAQETAVTETTTESGMKEQTGACNRTESKWKRPMDIWRNEITSEETNASETSDKPIDENESSENIKESVESTKDRDHSDQVKTSIVEGKDVANKEDNADTAVKLQEAAVTETTTESDQTPSSNKEIDIDDSENTVNETGEKTDIQTNIQENLINNTIDKSYASNQPISNCEVVDSQSDLSTALAQDDNTNVKDEVNRGIKRKNEEIEEEGTKIAKNSDLATSDDVDEANLVNADDNGLKNF